MTAAEAVKLVAVLKAAFPNGNVGMDTAQVYAAALGDLDYPAAERAVMEVIAKCRFFPTIAEIRECVAEASCGLPDAEQAWLEVSQAAARLSDIDRGTWWPEWSNDLIPEALQGVGGLFAVDRSSNPSADRAQFIRIYSSLRRRQVEAVAVGAICAPAGDRIALAAGDKKETS